MNRRTLLAGLLAMACLTPVLAGTFKFDTLDQGWKGAVGMGQLNDHIYVFMSDGTVAQCAKTDGKLKFKTVDEGWNDVTHVASNGEQMLVFHRSGELYQVWEEKGAFKNKKVDVGWEDVRTITAGKGVFYAVTGDGEFCELRLGSQAGASKGK